MPKFGTVLVYYLSNDTEMVIGKKDQQVEQKQWEDPSNPEKPSDERDQEQLQRQLNEAKRIKENLTKSDNDKLTKTKNI
jgi:hypothetical protein